MKKDTAVKHKSLTNRVVLITTSMVLMSCLAVAIFTIVANSISSQKMAQDQVKTSISLIENTVNEKLSYVKNLSQLVTTHDKLPSLISAADENNINKEIQLFSVDGFNVYVTDRNGIVLGTTSSAANLKSMLQVSFLTNVINGAEVNGYYSVGSDGFSAVYAAPLESNGSVVGMALITCPLTSSDLIDKMKSDSTTEYTIFENDTRVNTSIIKDGARFIGTKMGDNVKQTVLVEGQDFTMTAVINDAEYITYYMPLKNNDGTIVGSLFAGYPLSPINNNTFTNSIMSIIICIVMVTICVITGRAVLNHRVAKPLTKLAAAANQVSTGVVETATIDQMKGITNDNEIGVLANSMVSALSLSLRLHEVMENASIVAAEIDCGTMQVAEASQNLANGATTQASSIEQISSNIASISNEIKNTADKADSTNIITIDAKRDIEIGSKHMSELVKAMDEIEKSSHQIEKIIKTIEDIAFQTNILSLNAAVEAARAGEAGKGFGVVAEEVRNLANKSAEAVKSTSLLITNSLDAIENGSRIVSETEESLSNVITKTMKIGQNVDEIATATKFQSDAINEINLGVEQISNVVQTTSATAEETASSSEELAKQSQLLKEIIAKNRDTKQ